MIYNHYVLYDESDIKKLIPFYNINTLLTDTN